MSPVNPCAGAVLPVMATLFRVVANSSHSEKATHARVMRTVVDKGNGIRPDGEKVLLVNWMQQHGRACASAFVWCCIALHCGIRRAGRPHCGGSQPAVLSACGLKF